MVLSDGSIVITGGDNVGSYLNDVWKSVNGGSTWSLVTSSAPWSSKSTPLSFPSFPYIDALHIPHSYPSHPLPRDPTERARHNTVVLRDGSIILMGGYSGIYLNDVWKSGNGGSTWTLQTSSGSWTSRCPLGVSYFHHSHHSIAPWI